MRKIWRDVLIFSATAVSIPLIFLLLIRFTPKPPERKVENARVILSKAGTSKADTYSKKLFAEARIYYDSAMISWKKENKLSLIHISEPTRRTPISYAVFCL